MDDWDGIDEFVAVARTGSFIAGAVDQAVKVRTCGRKAAGA